MQVIGKNPSQGRRVTVKTSSSSTDQSAISHSPLSIPTASYIAEICGELTLMAKRANLDFLSHLLAMAQAEAEHASNKS